MARRLKRIQVCHSIRLEDDDKNGARLILVDGGKLAYLSVDAPMKRAFFSGRVLRQLAHAILKEMPD